MQRKPIDQWIVRHHRDHAIDAALARAGRRAPEVASPAREEVEPGRRLDDPRRLLQLRPSSCPAPAGVARRRPARGSRPPASSSKSPSPGTKPPRRRRRASPRRPGSSNSARHEHGRLLHRPADVARAPRPRRAAARSGHGLGDRGLGRPVEARGPAALSVVVLGDEHDRSPEVRVEERRRGEQQLSLQRVHAASLTGWQRRPTRTAAPRARSAARPAAPGRSRRRLLARRSRRARRRAATSTGQESTRKSTRTISSTESTIPSAIPITAPISAVTTPLERDHRSAPASASSRSPAASPSSRVRSKIVSTERVRRSRTEADDHGQRESST